MTWPPIRWSCTISALRQASSWQPLRAAVDARLDLADIDRRVRVSQRERRLVSAALRRGHYTPWDHQPQVDASRQYVRNRDDMYELQRRARLGQRRTGCAQRSLKVWQRRPPVVGGRPHRVY